MVLDVLNKYVFKKCIRIIKLVKKVDAGVLSFDVLKF